MLRTFLVLCLAAVGAYYALQGPFYALLFYVGNAYFRPEEWAWSGLIRSLNLSLISGWFLILISLISKQQFVVNRRVGLFFIFLMHTFLSTLFAEHFEYSWGYWLEFLKIIVITYLMVVLIKDFAQFRLLLLVMVMALGLLQAKQGLSHLITATAGPNTNMISFLGDNNGVAVGMLMLIPIIALLAQTAQRKWMRSFFWFLLLGILYRALSTYSRGGFLACLALGGVYWLRSPHKVRVLAGIVLLVMITLPVLPAGFWERMKTIQTYEEEEDSSAISRLHFWRVAVAMANQHPWLGIGHNGYNRSYDAYDFSDGEYGTKRSVHSSFYGVLAESGYVGLALYIAIMLSAFRSCHRVRKLTMLNSKKVELQKSAIALETSLVTFVVGGTFVPFQYNEMLWNIIGLTIVVENISNNDEFVISHEDDQSNIYEENVDVEVIEI